jgi:hypothetical protein
MSIKLRLHLLQHRLLSLLEKLRPGPKPKLFSLASPGIAIALATERKWELRRVENEAREADIRNRFDSGFNLPRLAIKEALTEDQFLRRASARKRGIR